MLKLKIMLPVFVIFILWFAGNSLSQEPELISQWPLDEESGEVVHDVLGGRDGDFMDGKFEWVPGKFGNGLLFDGAGGYIEVAKAPELELAESVTLMAWVNFSVVGGRQDIVSYADSYAVMTDSSTFRAFIFQGAWPMATGATTISANEWYFVAMTYDSTDVKVYINGELDGSMAAPGGITIQDASFWFGGAPADPGQPWWFNGILDEVEIWNAAMTEDEIMETYQAPPPSSPVEAKGKLATTWGDIRSR